MAIFNSYVICELIGKTIARSTMHFSWVVIHYFDWAMFNINQLNHHIFWFSMVFHGFSHHLPQPTSLKIHQDFRSPSPLSPLGRSSSRPTSEEVPSCRSLDKGSPDEQRGTPKTRGVGRPGHQDSCCNIIYVSIVMNIYHNESLYNY